MKSHTLLPGLKSKANTSVTLKLPATRCRHGEFEEEEGTSLHECSRGFLLSQHCCIPDWLCACRSLRKRWRGVDDYFGRDFRTFCLTEEPSTVLNGIFKMDVIWTDSLANAFGYLFVLRVHAWASSRRLTVWIRTCMFGPSVTCDVCDRVVHYNVPAVNVCARCKRTFSVTPRYFIRFINPVLIAAVE